MGIMSIFNKGNERLMKGLNYDSFTTIARNAEDNARSGGAIGDRKIRLTKDGKGLATTTFNGSLGYLNPGRTYYIIDTTKIPKGEKAWDMKCNMYENGRMERRMVPVEIEDPDSLTGVRDVEEPLDVTGGEVNVSYIPRNAIIGWESVSNMHMDTADDNRQRLDTLQRRISWDKNYTIQFNPEYKA